MNGRPTDGATYAPPSPPAAKDQRLPAAPAAADVWVVPLAAPPAAGDSRPFVDLKAKDTSGNDITVKALIDSGATSSQLKVTAAVGGQLGVSGGTAGAERSINGTSAATTGTTIPPSAAVGFSGSPVTPGGQAAAAPPLPTTATVGTLPPGRQATLGSGYLEANFDAHGRMDGYYWFVAKGQGATGGVATANAITSFLAFSAPVVSNPAGRPAGSKSEEVTPLRHTVPQGEEAADGGFALGVDVSSSATTVGNVPFLLKSGFAHTVLSAQWAAALGLDPATLPTGQFETNLGTMSVGLANLELDLFGDPSFPTFTVMVGIALNPADNPFGDSILGSDVLGQLAYWDLDQTNPAAPRFSAAAALSFVSEPSSAALLALPLLALLLGARRPEPYRRADSLASGR